MEYIYYTVFVFVLLSFKIKAQSVAPKPNTAIQDNAWVMYFGQHILAEKWKLHTEYQWRRSEYFKYWQQSLLRTGVEYSITPNLSGTLGYAWIYTFPYGEQPINTETGEQRIWQQLAFQNTIGRISIQHRYRLEQRWIENWVTNPDGTSFRAGYIYNNRFRYRLMINIPLTKPTISKGVTFLSIYNEPFISFGDAIKNNHLDQNRFYAAFGYQYSAQGNIQLGYLNQLFIKSDGVRREVNHTLQIGVTQHFDLRQKDLL